MKQFFSSLQWFVFIVANAIVAPIVIGGAFGLSSLEISTFLQRSLLIVGIAGLTQILFGHKFPVMEGPAGLWWGIFIVYAGLVTSGEMTANGGLRQLEGAMLVGGVLFVIVGLFRWVDALKRLFTPLVTGTYLILLVSQLSGSFIKGILGIGYLSENVEAEVALPAILVLILSVFLAKSSISWIRSYSVLISLSAGWMVFSLLGLSKKTSTSDSLVQWPQLFPFGAPEFNAGILITAIVTGLLLLTNMVASVNVVESVLKKQTNMYQPPNDNRASIVMGFNQWFAGLFGAVAPVPISGTAGFLMTTQIVERLPFILANILLVLISFFPSVTAVVANLPTPVGYAVVFLPIASLAGLGLREYQSISLGERELFIISASLMIGIGSLFVPASSLASLPDFLKTVANNGLILGMITCMLLEQLYRIPSRKGSN